MAPKETTPMIPRHSKTDRAVQDSPPPAPAPSLSETARSPHTLFLLFLSIIFSTANQITFKKLLNKFTATDQSHNYEFFVSQFTTLLYLIPSLAVCLLTYSKSSPKKRSSFHAEVKSSQWSYTVMGLLDAASSTLGAIGGALTPGQLQTLLNQTIIPFTIVISRLYLGTEFNKNQIVGASLVFFGAGVAGLPYFFKDQSPFPDPYERADAGTVSISIAIFAVSVVPSAMSNVYKEKAMKGKDLDVYFTTTGISIWQELLGFLFLPLLSFKALGGLSSAEIQTQWSDGYTCFTGANPTPSDNCSGATYLFLVYVFVNWGLNVLLLMLTKNGSAVMLVVANSLALPITNVAFSIKGIMGDDAEPFTVMDLVGLVAVVSGFLVYSSFGLAKKFTITQGPPGQMAKHTVTNENGGMVLTASDAMVPRKLAHFIVALYGGSSVRGSFTKALELSKRVVKVLEEYVVENKMPKIAGADLEQGAHFMTPRTGKGAFDGGVKGDGASRISPSNFGSY